MRLFLCRRPSVAAAALFCFSTSGLQRSVTLCARCNASATSSNVGKQSKRAKVAPDSYLKRRTRSDRVFDHESVRQYVSEGDHVPVMLGEVLEVFGRPNLRSFVDCTVGAAGHSSSIIQAHPELELYVGLDVDPTAHEKAQSLINAILGEDPQSANPSLKASILMKNFRVIKSVLHEVDNDLLDDGVDGILMDLGISSMQVNNARRGFSVLNDGPLDMRMDPGATLKAKDILNSWPEEEVGRVLRDYGEESHWHRLLTKIMKARLHGGICSTGELVDIIRSASPKTGGRHGWIKTATRVFQALRIAVNDELNTLEDALLASFDCLSAGGRLAVISFHSLEDRIVKKTFLKIINDEEARYNDSTVANMEKDRNEYEETEPWIKQRIVGRKGIILTKRPVTPTEEEEKVNRRCRSAKLRVIEKAR
ncbi:hypothetical protein H6P81_010139 [Aristolochia fimbriata]|uniref:Uncharacterized protein n=1 Tax=Aristolochia fimbriata TaxID=158543 RepID=A0AAV7EP53_ARIFI|nr:hypothetical protein H6P81_010139 [Aristolochia fimbriata]